MKRTTSIRGALAIAGATLAIGVGAACGGGATTDVSGGAGGDTSGAGASTNASSTRSTATTASDTTITTSTASSGNGCTSDTDCPSATMPQCDLPTGKCVGCVPGSDHCASGQYCDATTLACTQGCDAASDCMTGQVCDTASHACVTCVVDTDCAAGNICQNNMCVAGCSPTQNCAGTLTCCDTTCVDITSDPNNCNTCANACPSPPHTVPTCAGSICSSTCAGSFIDCDGDPMNGCEHDGANGPCACTPGATQPCYTGAAGTEGVGPCVGGTETCAANGLSWGACFGEIVPTPEICSNGIDEDCDGTVDNVPDIDGDGWTVCDGDCCETTAQCSDPKLVNPGALEVVGDGVDNDCDPTTSDTVPVGDCSSGTKFAGVTGSDIAQAMDICQTTTANPPLATKKWGLITASERLANGAALTPAQTGEFQNNKAAIKINFGTGGVVPQKGPNMAVISTGKARAHADAGWVNPIDGTTFSDSIAFAGAGAPLGTYLAQHMGNLLPGQCGTTSCDTGTGANDSSDVRFTIRVPTNAFGFSYNFRFYSAEYQTYQCTAFNDYFLAMLQSGNPMIPADHNISFDALHNAVSVNNGFFQDCGGNGQNCNTCPFGTGSLAGTGFDTVSGGSTEWLTTDAPIVPGETITIEFVLFDVQDHIYDTLVLLDNFHWQITPVGLGTH